MTKEIKKFKGRKMERKILELNFVIIFLLTYGVFNPISVFISLKKSDILFGEWVVKTLSKREEKYRII